MNDTIHKIYRAIQLLVTFWWWRWFQSFTHWKLELLHLEVSWFGDALLAMCHHRIRYESTVPEESSKIWKKNKNLQSDNNPKHAKKSNKGLLRIISYKVLDLVKVQILISFRCYVVTWNKQTWKLSSNRDESEVWVILYSDCCQKLAGHYKKHLISSKVGNVCIKTLEKIEYMLECRCTEMWNH